MPHLCPREYTLAASPDRDGEVPRPSTMPSRVTMSGSHDMTCPPAPVNHHVPPTLSLTPARPSRSTDSATWPASAVSS